MSYTLSLTDRSKHISAIRYVSTIENLIHIFNTNIYPLVNKRYYDDDFPSITIYTNKSLYSYFYHGKGKWSRKSQFEYFIIDILPEKKNLSWNDLVDDWIKLLKEKYSLYTFVFEHTDNLHLVQLETLFGRTTHIHHLADEFSILIS